MTLDNGQDNNRLYFPLDTIQEDALPVQVIDHMNNMVDQTFGLGMYCLLFTKQTKWTICSNTTKRKKIFSSLNLVADNRIVVQQMTLDNDQELGTKKKIARLPRRQSFSKEQTEEIQQYFEEFITQKKCPSLTFCRDFLMNQTTIDVLITEKQIQDKIRNLIKASE